MKDSSAIKLRRTLVKRVSKRQTPEEVARESLAITKNTRHTGFSSSNKLYSKSQAQKDIAEQINTDPFDLPRSYSKISEEQARVIARNLVDFSKTHYDIAIFFGTYELAPKVFYNLVDRYEFMDLAYDVAKNNFACNMIEQFRIDNKPFFLQSLFRKERYYHPTLRKYWHADKEFEQKLRNQEVERATVEQYRLVTSTLLDMIEPPKDDSQEDV